MNSNDRNGRMAQYSSQTVVINKSAEILQKVSCSKYILVQISAGKKSFEVFWPESFRLGLRMLSMMDVKFRTFPKLNYFNFELQKVQVARPPHSIKVVRTFRNTRTVHND